MTDQPRVPGRPLAQFLDGLPTARKKAFLTRLGGGLSNARHAADCAMDPGHRHCRTDLQLMVYLSEAIRELEAARAILAEQAEGGPRGRAGPSPGPSCTSRGRKPGRSKKGSETMEQADMGERRRLVAHWAGGTERAGVLATELDDVDRAIMTADEHGAPWAERASLYDREAALHMQRATAVADVADTCRRLAELGAPTGGALAAWAEEGGGVTR